jgi:hypothetical protein
MDRSPIVAKPLTVALRCARSQVVHTFGRTNLRWSLLVIWFGALLPPLAAQHERMKSDSTPLSSFAQIAPSGGNAVRSGVRQIAAIHWQNVPLSDARLRLEKLFGDSIFLDRRVDLNLRVNIDIQASSAEDVLEPIAATHELGICRMGRLIYLGSSTTADQLSAVAAARVKDLAQLLGSKRVALSRTSATSSRFNGRQRIQWPRLTEPRGLITSLVEQHGWRIAEAQRIPHDLWGGGSLPELELAEQLSVLLIGFDLTFQIRPGDQTIEIVSLGPRDAPQRRDTVVQAPARRVTLPPQNGRQVYTLRVVEKPVGTVLRELASRLNWTIEIDQAAIRAAGRSLEERVSFAVENVDENALLDAVLRPAGLDYRRDGKRLRIIPREDASG